MGAQAIGSATVIVSAKGAARWQAGHPWIYRTDIYDEPRDAAGIVTRADRRGRPPRPALYSPKSEIQPRLPTRRREPPAAARGGGRHPSAAAPPAGIGATAPPLVHAQG